MQSQARSTNRHLVIDRLIAVDLLATPALHQATLLKTISWKMMTVNFYRMAQFLTFDIKLCAVWIMKFLLNIHQPLAMVPAFQSFTCYMQHDTLDYD